MDQQQQARPSTSHRPADERLAELEALVAQVLARARAHPAGRKILAYLGLK